MVDEPERIFHPDRLLSESNGAEENEPLDDAVSSAVALDVHKAREGDQAAIARLIRQHSTQAYRVAFAILGNQHDAEVSFPQKASLRWRLWQRRGL